MTYEEFLANINILDKKKTYNYISNKGSFEISRVDGDIVKVYVLNDSNKKEYPISRNIIEAYLSELEKGHPIDCAKVVGESGSFRSIPPSLLCLMPHIFALKIKKRTNMIELKEKTHTLGELEFINEEDVAEKIKLEERFNRERIESEFKNYLTNIARSKQTGRKLTDSSISSYLLFLKCEKLFDYNPQKWSTIESIYDITSLDKINEILQTLLKDPAFVNRNSSDNNGFRARSLKQYRDFLIYQTSMFDNYDTEEEEMKSIENDLFQKIFFGAPGTGKSHKIDFDLFKDKNGNSLGKGIKEIPDDRKFRTTFHPDYDYAQFVGAYKPKKELNETTNKEEITYSFVPQVFAKAYAAAWKLYFSAGNSSTSENQVYLIIEEINRGNCAQIFGDIFQLLDRNGEGFSQYSIDADCDFADWLGKYSDLSPESIWNEYKKKENVGAGKLKLPPNLNILATMNTSDQSLFPMDSAFKRRFDWEYVQIKYKKDEECGKNWNADTFKIAVGNSKYMWLDFLEKVNADIYEATRSEDKQMGEFFIKPKDGKKILFEDFRSKVLFYLWDSVYKDETERQTVFHFAYENGDDKIKSVTFQSLFGKDAEAIVNKIMENLKVEKVTA